MRQFTVKEIIAIAAIVIAICFPGAIFNLWWIGPVIIATLLFIGIPITLMLIWWKWGRKNVNWDRVD